MFYIININDFSKYMLILNLKNRQSRRMLQNHLLEHSTGKQVQW